MTDVRRGAWSVACAVAILIVSAATAAGPPQSAQAESYLFAWTADADGNDPDFLAVIDASPASPTYGTVLRTLPVGMKKTNAHHTEPQMPADGLLLANGFDAGVTFRFDLRDPLRPVLMPPLAVPPPYQHAHSFLRLPDGRILATYQYQGDDHRRPGGIVAYAADGRVLGTGSAIDPSIDEFIRPYGIDASPTLDLAVTTSHDMHGGGTSRAIQIWRLSNLHRLSTVLLPPGPRGDENVSAYEPRFLQDGVTAVVATRSCGLYVLDRLETGRPVPVLVHTFADTRCFVPVVIGHYWVQPLGRKPEIVVLDMTDARRPREVSRLKLADGEVAHWLARSDDGRRVVVTGFSALERRLLVLAFDPATGALSFDRSFGEGGSRGLSFDRETWPHGATGAAIPHGVVFSRR